LQKISLFVGLWTTRLASLKYYIKKLRVVENIQGVLEDGFVAVKKLYSYIAIEDEPFHREVDCLMNIRHHNIVLFVGYCAETQEVVVRQEGKHIFAEKRERLLCFEYLHNGSLHKHLTGMIVE
jgi:serine/threonine protein kinase